MLENTLNIIEKDLIEGKKFLACNKLRNLINDYPDDFFLRERLAEIYFESNFLDYAGLYWMLTEPKTENIKLAQDTYLQSVNYSSYKILNDIRFCGDRRLLTDYARNTIIKLEKDCEKKKITLPKFKRKSNKKRVQHQTKDTSGCFGKYLGAFIVIFFIIILLLGLQSLFTIIKSFFYN